MSFLAGIIFGVAIGYLFREAITSAIDNWRDR